MMTNADIGSGVGTQQDWVLSSGGVAVPRSYATRLTAFDLFAGAGGFSLGFMQAGFHVVGGMDNDPCAAITYMSNLCSYPCQIHYGMPEDEERLEAELQLELKRATKAAGKGGVVKMPTAGGYWLHSHQRLHPEVQGVGHFFFGDIRSFTGQQILDAIGMRRGELGCVMGGPPCQGFSRAGRREVMDPRNSLVFEFVRLVLELHPKAMCMENVPGILSMVTPDGLPVVDAVCRALEDGGFGTVDALKRALLTTSGCGAALRGQRKGAEGGEPEDEDEEPAEAPVQQALF
ncbi:MAG: DNA cytosine methyltransferase [Anaerolineae bacterium]